ncbi:MAG: hypothetical protein A3J93_04210 [Candidatus Magasanikbacteria bacterium RIFOXYC2_FULL_42_28]|uniref:PEP-utilising enzyme mobile domain-containing protein n=1 Tax=Candidatus Magasanikbacteria bacterium RIFOXYC2_FULL_42_28 TaxID=1798704 RepID=A0A1F6NX44_9BACT|nr:MAG: hypothetical protein A3J93_04210 [Candidatus Magasanikbacteria bacterium RIFOXYC2_FULL_42_28]
MKPIACDYYYLSKQLKKYGLALASQRNLSLFFASAVAKGYLGQLRRIMGFSYRAVAVCGGDNELKFLFNENYIIKSVADWLKQNDEQKLSKILALSYKIYYDSLIWKKEAQVLAKADPIKCLCLIIKHYSRYLAGIGVYNVFWRYFSVPKNERMDQAKLIERISARREQMAKIYPRVEKIVSNCCEQIGRRYNYDGDLLRYFTISELRVNLHDNLNLNNNQLQELCHRKNGYFFFSSENKEELTISNKKIVDKINRKFLKVNVPSHRRLVGKGVGGGGKVIGRAVKFINRLDARLLTLLPGNDLILVVSATHPNDVAIIKKFQAIIANEGGVLSHAAVVARELKIPAIIGVKNATEILKTGDWVEVDANKGIVTLIKK